jgi:hypothetical protein
MDSDMIFLIHYCSPQNMEFDIFYDILSYNININVLLYKHSFIRLPIYLSTLNHSTNHPIVSLLPDTTPHPLV